MLANSYNVNSLRRILASTGPRDLPQVPSKIDELPKCQFLSSTKPDTSTTKDPKGKYAIGKLSLQGTMGTRCFRCQSFGHFVVQYLTRTFLVEGALDEDKHEYVEEVYDPEYSASDAEEAIRMSNIRLNVVRCLLVSPRDGDRHRSSIFHTYIRHNDKHYKVMIDGGHCVNIIVKSVVEKMNLKEPHPQPYASWVDKIAQSVTQYYLMPIQFSSYQERLWSDILATDVTHILLGRP